MIFNKKPLYKENRYKEWHTPSGSYYNADMDILNAPHALIAGATGSGKSVMINRLIYTIMLRSPAKARLILIDPKKVELSMYRRLPHTICYADELNTAIDALRLALSIMEDRYKEMQRKGLRMYDGAKIYIVIDEYADLSVLAKKQVEPLIMRIAQLGRAAKIMLILATQCPKAKIIPTEVKVNFPCKIALRVPSAQDSRNIIDRSGAETLPQYGKYYRLLNSEYGIGTNTMISDADINNRIQWWMQQA